MFVLDGFVVSDEVTEAIIENEMLLSFFLQKIKNCISEFQFHYSALEAYSKQEHVAENRNEIWDSISEICNSTAQVSRIFDSGSRTKGTPDQKDFTKNRGELLTVLAGLSKDDFTELKALRELRNRVVHFDEDVDDWFLASNKSVDRTMVWRDINDSTKLNHDGSTCLIQSYNCKTGILYNLGIEYSFHELHRKMGKIAKGAHQADVKLSKLCPNRSNMTIK